MKIITQNNKRQWAICVLILLIGGFFISTLRDGHNWGGDFSLYIHHAKNIVEGVDYFDTNLITNPSYVSLSPKGYPPILPLLIAPIYKWFGIDFTIMKIELILFFLAALFVIYTTFREDLNFKYLLAIIALTGLHPFFWALKDSLISELPFTFFLYMSIFLVYRYENSVISLKGALSAIATGILIYLAYGTRTIGIVFIPSLVIYDLLKHRKLTGFTGITLLVFTLFFLLQKSILQTSGTYTQIVLTEFEPINLIYNFRNYLSAFTHLWYNGYERILLYPLSLFFLGLTIAGFLKRLFNRITVIEVFIVFYMAAAIIYPYDAGIRLLMPLLPIIFLYLFTGVKSIRGNRLSNSTFALIIIALIVTYTLTYTKKHTEEGFLSIKENVTKKESVELFGYIKESTAKDAIFIFKKPRVLALFTGRHASVYHKSIKYAKYRRGDKQEGMANYINRIKATHLIVAAFDPDRWREFVHMHDESLERVYTNSDFDLYKIKSALRSSNE